MPSVESFLYGLQLPGMSVCSLDILAPGTGRTYFIASRARTIEYASSERYARTDERYDCPNPASLSFAVAPDDEINDFEDSAAFFDASSEFRA